MDSLNVDVTQCVYRGNNGDVWDSVLSDGYCNHAAVSQDGDEALLGNIDEVDGVDGVLIDV